jgi:hypothetical protein
VIFEFLRAVLLKIQAAREVMLCHSVRICSAVMYCHHCCGLAVQEYSCRRIRCTTEMRMDDRVGDMTMGVVVLYIRQGLRVLKGCWGIR